MILVLSLFSLLLLQPFNFSPVSFACNFHDWGCVILREIDFLLKICWSIPCLHPSWKVHTCPILVSFRLKSVYKTLGDTIWLYFIYCSSKSRKTSSVNTSSGKYSYSTQTTCDIFLHALRLLLLRRWSPCRRVPCSAHAKPNPLRSFRSIYTRYNEMSVQAMIAWALNRWYTARHGVGFGVVQTGQTFSHIAATGGFCGLKPPKQSSKPTKLNMIHYKSVEFLSNFLNVKPGTQK